MTKLHKQLVVLTAASLLSCSVGVAATQAFYRLGTGDIAQFTGPRVQCGTSRINGALTLLCTPLTAAGGTPATHTIVASTRTLVSVIRVKGSRSSVVYQGPLR